MARVIPAGNVPGVILNGLARLPDRKPPLKTLKRDVNLLFTGIEQSLDRAVYSTFFAGPTGRECRSRRHGGYFIGDSRRQS